MRNQHESGIALATALLVLALLSAMLVGFMLLVSTDQQLSGINKQQTASFYAAEAGMEKMTADLGTLFESNYAPSGAQINALTQVPPPLPGIQYVDPINGSGYRIAFPADPNGNPRSSNATISSGPYEGMVGLLTPYTLTVTARTLNGGESKLIRNLQTVAIPVFEFGVFSQTDLSFFAGPNYNFGGRVHTNGNLFLASGSTLTLSDRVTAVGEVIRTNLSNSWPTSNGYTGTVNVDTAPNNYRALGVNEGSLVGTLGSPQNEPTWTNVSIGSYNGNIRNGRTGAKALNLAIVTLGNGITSPVEIIRRPLPNENNTNPGVLGERYFSQASVHILLSDNPQDIMNLPCTNPNTPPVDLSTLARPVANLPPWYTAGVPLPTSGATGANNTYSSTDGYWQPNGTPVITGWLKVEVQAPYGSPCGPWTDVTREILNLGVAGRNLHPDTSVAPPQLPILPGNQQPPSGCADPSPNAVIRFERVRDNPSTGAGNPCGNGSTNPIDYWPNALFDTREGTPRDVAPSAPNSGQVSLGGVMYYVELDVNNLGRWLTGAIGASGPQAFDATNPTHDFAIYFSDRRGNHNGNPLVPGTETGEFGFEDSVNSASQWGCPNTVLDPGEDFDGDGVLKTYGQVPVLPAGLLTGVTTTALAANINCAVVAPSNIWPGMFYTDNQDARENPPLFFRRALKLVNGISINTGGCQGGVLCGLTVASENPVYVQGDYNAPGQAFGAQGTHPAVAVIADAVTLLSDNWNDVNSFISPYNTNGRRAVNTWYRLAIVSGKGISFPHPAGYASYQDFGTDGGMHNFLRFLENWGGQNLTYRGSLTSFYFNRQGIGLYKCCATVYSPPTRVYNFDVEFLQPALLPPRTPVFHDVNTTGFTQIITPTQ